MQHDIPGDVNGDVLRRLVADGDNLSVPRTLDFQIIFPDEKSATRFAEVVSSKFDSVKIELFLGRHAWTCLGCNWQSNDASGP
jgi:hypothetical protein